MKKAYSKPVRTITVTSFDRLVLLTGSDAKGVGTGSKLGNEYNSQDVSYSRSGYGDWDEE